jgi:hypothetical protein
VGSGKEMTTVQTKREEPRAVWPSAERNRLIANAASRQVSCLTWATDVTSVVGLWAMM